MVKYDLTYVLFLYIVLTNFRYVYRVTNSCYVYRDIHIICPSLYTLFKTL